MAGLYKKYSEQGVHIIGLEAQMSPAAVIDTFSKTKNVTYQLTSQGDVKGAGVRGLPHNYLFGADGRLVGEQVPLNELDKKFKDLIPEVNAALAGPGPYVKLATLAATVKTGQGLGQALKTLRTKKDSKDADEAKEAAMMLESLGGAAQARLEKAESFKATDPTQALALLDKVATAFAGDEIADKAQKEATAMRADPAVRKEVEAEGMWKQVEALLEKVKPGPGGDKSLSSDAVRKLNIAVLQNIAGGCQSISQRYPGTKAAAKADDLLSKLK